MPILRSSNSAYSPFVVGSAKIKIKDVVSMTSDDVPGETYFYDGTRFNLLYGLFDTVSGTSTPQSYMTQVQKRILEPLHMFDTVCGFASSPAQLQRRMAKRYSAVSNNGPWQYKDAGPYWDVTWPSGGLISTIDDLAKYAGALDSNTLIRRADYDVMTTPRKDSHGHPHPYAYGGFSQSFEGIKIDWAYGQGQAESAVFLRVPARRLTFIFLSNSNAPSDEAQLAYGDVKRSPLALAFLRAFVSRERFRPRNEDFSVSAARIKADHKDDWADLDFDELLNEALLAEYTSDFTLATDDRAKDIAELLLKVAPESFKRGNEYLLYLLSRIQIPRLCHGSLQLIHSFNPIADKRPEVALWLGDLYLKLGVRLQALDAFKLLADRSGFDDVWMKIDACDKLAHLYAEGNYIANYRKYVWQSALLSFANHDEDNFKRKVLLLGKP